MVQLFHSESSFLFKCIKGYPLFSARSFLLDRFSMRSLINFKIIFVKGENMDTLLFQQVEKHICQHHLLNMLYVSIVLFYFPFQKQSRALSFYFGSFSLIPLLCRFIITSSQSLFSFRESASQPNECYGLLICILM